jgi:hypothetical protein
MAKSRIFFLITHARGKVQYTAEVPVSMDQQRILQLIKSYYLGRTPEGKPTKEFKVKWLLINPRLDSLWYVSDWADIKI